MTLPPLRDGFSGPAARDVALGSPAHDDQRSPVMRKVQIASLTRSSTVHVTDQVGPATPLFDSAFSAFAHGTLIKTGEGQVAVEDLQPGMEIVTNERGAMPLLWIGMMTLVPDRDGLTPTEARLTRVMTDSFGPTRPSEDFLAGPGARLLTRPGAMHDIVGAEHILTPARDLCDGVNVIDVLPPGPISLYHLCLQRHATISAAGLQAETFHPGPGFERGMTQHVRSQFLSLFPHIHAPTDFGPLVYPRVARNGRSET